MADGLAGVTPAGGASPAPTAENLERGQNFNGAI